MNRIRLARELIRIAKEITNYYKPTWEGKQKVMGMTDEQKELAASNPETSQDVLGTLADDSNYEIRLMVAKNSGTSDEILKYMKGDSNKKVNKAVCDSLKSRGIKVKKKNNFNNSYYQDFDEDEYVENYTGNNDVRFYDCNERF